MLVGGLLKSDELCRTDPREVAVKSGDSTVVDGNTGSDIAVGVALIDRIAVEVATEKRAELSIEVAAKSLVEEAMERTVDIAEELVEITWLEIATDCMVDVVDGVTVTEDVAGIVKAAIVDKGAIIEDDVGTALVETATPKEVAETVDKPVAAEDGVGTALEERLSALMMSAAFERLLDACLYI